jgi:hypothetical protein
VEVRVREAPGRWVAFAKLNREHRDRVLSAQDKIAAKFGAVAFELILVYPEDEERVGVQQMLRTTTLA